MTATAELVAAHAAIVPMIRTIPDAALDWRAGDEEWSIKQIIGHLAHANDFYVMIVDEARATSFGAVVPRPELDGWQRMAATDAAVAECRSTQAALDCFERTYSNPKSFVNRHRAPRSAVLGSQFSVLVGLLYQGMLAILYGITADELDWRFVFRRPDAEPYTTTLRQRVIQTAASHICEHQAHLFGTLARWRAAQQHDEKLG
ncbi:MAG: DinB family protein [Roseiflexaceae bacterium]